MSTRRARIKAVTALPPRRKNVAVAENTKAAKINSPKPTIPDVINNQENIKETVPTSTVNDQLSNTSETETAKAQIENKNTHTENLSAKENKTQPVTPSPSIRNVFASPILRNSPKRTFASPNRPAPQIASKSIETPKTVTPQHQATPTRHELSENIELQVASNSITKVRQNVGSKEIPDDYNVPSVPESITDDPMDGIVPLQPAGSASKPIDKLKSEIISENAVVLFDPIVPLPSPSKVRPKLRPIPRLGPRRNSIQGSASESEDESRRSLLSGGSTTPAPARQRHDSHTSHSTLQSLLNREVSRVRNDSICSNISQATGQQTPASPLKEKLQKSRRMEASRRLMAMRRRREAVKREALTMYDLIYYNPTTNPIVPDKDEIKAKEESVKDLEKQKAEMKEEENVDDPPESDAAPVPQMKLGPNGEIVLDESSLVIKQTQTQKVSSVVREGAWLPSRGQYRRVARSADWSSRETVRFYRALAAIGTDFTLMAPLFPTRTRRELKMKFKKEEKINGAQVDKALRSRIEWDAISLKEEFAEEREAEKRKEQEEKDKFLREKKAERDRIRAAKEIGQKNSRGVRALEQSVKQGTRYKGIATADDILERAKRSADPVKRPILKTPEIPKNKPTPPMPGLNTLAMLNKRPRPKDTPSPANSTPTPKLSTPTLNKTPELVTSLNNIPPNIETGSLIVLTVNNPKSPGKKMLQTYIAREPGKLTQVALPPVLLNSVVGFMKKGTPKSTTSNSSSPLLSPNSNNDSRNSTPSARSSDSANRKRNSSFSITQL